MENHHRLPVIGGTITLETIDRGLNPSHALTSSSPALRSPGDSAGESEAAISASEGPDVFGLLDATGFGRAFHEARPVSGSVEVLVGAGPGPGRVRGVDGRSPSTRIRSHSDQTRSC